MKISAYDDEGDIGVGPSDSASNPDGGHGSVGGGGGQERKFRGQRMETPSHPGGHREPTRDIHWDRK